MGEDMYRPMEITQIVRIHNGWTVHTAEGTQLFRTTHELRDLIDAYIDGEVTQDLLSNDIHIRGESQI